MPETLKEVKEHYRRVDREKMADLAERFKKSLRHQRFSYGIKGRPAKDARPIAVQWYITGELADDRQAIGESKKSKGMFVVATNELDSGL